MPSNYPSNLDNFTNPTPANNLNDVAVLHSDEHSNANDAITALEKWVGVSGSTNPATIEYRVNHIPGGGGGGLGVVGWNTGVLLGTGTIFNVRGQNFLFTISGTVLDLFLTGSIPAHASQHENGGFDPIPLDLLAAPVFASNFLDANTGTHGLMRPLSGDPTNYIGGDGLEHAFPAVEEYYLDDSSMVTGTKSLLLTYPTGSIASISQAILSTSTGTAFAIPFLSIQGPIDFIANQEIKVVVQAQITAGTKFVFLYSQLLKYSSSGTETLVGTSNLHQISSSLVEYDFGMGIPDTNIDPTERLELKFFGIAQGAGSTPTATLFYDGNTSSRLELGGEFRGGGGTTIVNNFLGLFGENGGVPLGTGTTFNVRGAIFTLSGSNFDLFISGSSNGNVGVWSSGTFIGNTSALNFLSPLFAVTGTNMQINVGVTGVMLVNTYDPDANGIVNDSESTRALQGRAVFAGISPASGDTLIWSQSALRFNVGSVLSLFNFPQDNIGVMGQNAGVPLGTGTILNVRGANAALTISGTTLDLFVTGSAGPVLVQTTFMETGSGTTGGTQMPLDDTIPQNTEGDQYMVLSITPKNSSNKLYIRVIASLSTANPDWIVGALFQDSNVNALAAMFMYNDTALAARVLVLEYKMIAGTTSPTTFKFRAGHGNAAADTMTFNGVGGARYMGGVAASSIYIQETTG